MKSRLSLLFLVIAPLACSTPEPDNPVVNLVPAEALTTVFPAAVDSFAQVRDTTYLGYRETETDTLALITVARIYESASGQRLAINLSSFDSRELFMATYGDSAIRDTTVEMEAYQILLGRMVMADDYHSAEAKAFDSVAVRAAPDLIDYEQLASLATEPIEVDSMFLVRTD